MARSVKSNTDKAATSAETAMPKADAVGEVEVSVPQPEMDTTPEQLPLPDQSPQPEPPQPELVDRTVPDPLPPPAQITRPAHAAQKSGVGPVVLGGVVAAALGYAAAYFGQQSQSAALTLQITAQSDRIGTLETQLATLSAPPDLSLLDTQISELQAALTGQQTETTTGIAALDARLAALEKAPNADGTLSATAIAAWEEELQTLRAEIGAERSQMQTLVDAATTQLDTARVEVANIEQAATESAVALTARAALTRVQAALESGGPFDAALGDLSASVEVPAALTVLAPDGVPTLSVLQAEFPDAARAALAVARSEGLAGEEGGGLAAFLRNQFDVRSVIPLEGATADAILSRAEEDLRQSRLSDAMAEVASLPEVVRAEMSDWITAAETRSAAISAVESLSEILTQN